MKVIFRQTQKELFSAEFVAEINGVPYGHFTFQGALGSMNGTWKGIFSSKTFSMYAEDEKKHNWKDSYYRPYLFEIDATRRGCVFKTEHVKNWFSRYDYHKMTVNGLDYQLYPIGYGKDGYRSPVYQDNTQIALVEKDAVVYNDLHTYAITATDEQNAFISILFCCYMYAIGCYVPGEKVSQSVVKNFNKSTNKDLLAKDDFSFSKANM